MGKTSYQYQNKVCATCRFRAQVSTKQPCVSCLLSHPANYPNWESVENQTTKNRCNLCEKQESIDCVICDGSYFVRKETKQVVKNGNPDKMFGPNIVKHKKVIDFLDNIEEKRQCRDLGIKQRGKYDDSHM